jgi:hypothetical protein
MAGGDLSEATLVSERYLLDLKEKLCLYVLKEKHWNPHMLTKGKP